jgi:hypothetical protein
MACAAHSPQARSRHPVLKAPRPHHHAAAASIACNHTISCLLLLTVTVPTLLPTAGNTLEWKDGKAHGRGKQEWPSGNIYEGNFSNGMKEGTGVCRLANGNIYEGNWRNGNKDGTGVLRSAEGVIYDGGYKNGLREGRGVLTYAVDGKQPDELGGCSFNAKDKFDGVFKENKRHGACTYTFFNGETFNCTFVEGRCAEFDQRQAAVRAAPDAASVQARAEGFASA